MRVSVNRLALIGLSRLLLLVLFLLSLSLTSNSLVAQEEETEQKIETRQWDGKSKKASPSAYRGTYPQKADPKADPKTGPQADPKADLKKAQKKRRVNPAMAPVEDVDGLPRVLLIGDSISIGYTVQVPRWA